MQFNDTLKMLVKHDLKNNNIPMLLGEPGIGKSSWVEDLARDLHTKAFTLACNQLADKSDLTGARLVPVKNTYTQVFYPHVVINNAIDYAKKHTTETPILFLDELNRTTPDVTSEALSIPTMRLIGNTTLPDNLKVITAGNDKGNVSSLDEASISRFVLYHVSPSASTFLNLDSNLHPAIKTVLTSHPDYIFQKELPAINSDSDDDDSDSDDTTYQNLDDIFDTNSFAQITTPRTITALSKWLNSYNDSDLASLLNTPSDLNEDSSVLEDSIIAHTGNTVFSSEVYNQLTTMLTTTSAQTSNTLTKPQDFDKLITANSVTDLDNIISGLTDQSRQACLLYALYDKHNNESIINELAKSLTQFDNPNLVALMKLVANNSLSDDNVAAFLSLSLPIVNQTATILSAN